MIKLMILGAAGQLGQELKQLCALTDGFDVVAYDRKALDITDAEAVSEAIKKEQPDCVVNAAAYTAVDKAESDAENAFLINETGVKNIAQACLAESVRLIHISTDYVFNGQKDSPYNEKDIADPQSVYGLSKFKGEEAVREILPKHIILRVSWVFGLHGHNFVKSILRLAGEHDELKIVADQLGNPTSTVNISKVILQITTEICAEKFKENRYGTYHYSDAPETTWFGFASAIVESAKAAGAKGLKVEKILPIMTHEYPTPAKRPENSRLSTALIEKRFGVRPAEWRPELDILIQELVNT